MATLARGLCLNERLMYDRDLRPIPFLFENFGRDGMKSEGANIRVGRAEINEHDLGILAMTRQTRWAPLEILEKLALVQVHRVLITPHEMRRVEHLMPFAQDHRLRVNLDNPVGVIQRHGNLGVRVNKFTAHDNSHVSVRHLYMGIQAILHGRE